MEKVYLLIGSDKYLVNQEIQQLISDSSLSDYECLSFDATELKVEEFLMEAKTISLFDSGKILVLKGIENYQRVSKKQFDELNNLIKEPSEGLILIFTTANETNLSELKEVMKKYSYIITVNKLDENNLTKLVISKLASVDIKIEPLAVAELITRCGSDLYLLENEIQKLIHFVSDSKLVKNSDITNLVSKVLDENIFDLSEALIQQNQSKLIAIYSGMIEINIDPLYIMMHLATRLREIRYIQLLIEQGYKQEQIAEQLKMKSGRVFYLMKDAKKINKNLINKLINQFAELDFKIKSGRIDKKIGLELLLLGNN